MDQNTSALMHYDAAKMSPLIGYLLWFFLGYFGAHRFYTGRVGSGVAMALLTVSSSILTLILIGFLGLLAVVIWWIVDAFLLNGWIRQHNVQLATTLSS